MKGSVGMTRVRRSLFISLALGVCMLLAAVAKWIEMNNFIDRAEHAQGTVVKMLKTFSPGSEPTDYTAVVRFTTRNGRVVTFEDPFRSSPAQFKVGERVEVLYPADNPAAARTRTSGSLWSAVTLLGIGGAVFVVMGGGLLLRRPARAK